MQGNVTMNSFNHMLGGQSARSFLQAKSCNKKWTKQGTIFQREENHSDVTRFTNLLQNDIFGRRIREKQFVTDQTKNMLHSTILTGGFRACSICIRYNSQH